MCNKFRDKRRTSKGYVGEPEGNRPLETVKFSEVTTTDLKERSLEVFVRINLLKPSGFFKYRQVRRSKILHGVRFALGVLYGYQNRQRLLLYISLTDWFL